MPTKQVDFHISPAAVNCKLLVDGEEMKNVRAVTIQARVGEITTVVFELVNVDVHLTGEVEDVTTLLDDTRRYRTPSEDVN